LFKVRACFSSIFVETRSVVAPSRNGKLYFLNMSGIKVRNALLVG
jgi:hypothetical protein